MEGSIFQLPVFFIGAYCKEYNEDFMLCKAANRAPEHCLAEGRKVTRCAQDLSVRWCRLDGGMEG